MLDRVARVIFVACVLIAGTILAGLMVALILVVASFA